MKRIFRTEVILSQFGFQNEVLSKNPWSPWHGIRCAALPLPARTVRYWYAVSIFIHRVEAWLTRGWLQFCYQTTFCYSFVMLARLHHIIFVHYAIWYNRGCALLYFVSGAHGGRSRSRTFALGGSVFCACSGVHNSAEVCAANMNLRGTLTLTWACDAAFDYNGRYVFSLLCPSQVSRRWN